MLQSAKKDVSRDFDDYSDIDQYRYQEPELRDLLRSSKAHNRLRAKGQLNKLISNEAADYLQAKVSQLRRRGSEHLVDLSKKDAGQAPKRQTVLFDKPQERRWQWPSWRRKDQAAAPKVSKLSASIELAHLAAEDLNETEAVLVSQGPPSPIRQVMIFAVITLCLIIPVKTIWLAGQLLEAKDQLLALGGDSLASWQAGGQALSDSDFQSARASFESANLS